jgi:hypothetical protein
MSEYYFVTTLLPELRIGDTSELAGEEFEFTLEQNLTERDLHKITILRRHVDIENIRLFWQGAPLEPGGNFDEKAIEANLLTRKGLPQYVFDYMKKYEESRERLSHFGELLSAYFEQETKENRGFVRAWLQFELTSRLIFVTLRSKSLGRTLPAPVTSEVPENDSFGFPLEQKEELPPHPLELYRPLQAIFESNRSNPLALHHALLQWKFDHIEEMCGPNPFHVNRIFSYVLRLILAEKWLRLDKKKGLQFVEKVGIA